jgi:ParB family chromosome partitioning protein
VIEAARRTMGRIDLDPASCPAANRTVRAAHYYSQRVDGLDRSHTWTGCVWLNPPYGGLAAGFTDRLLAELSAGNVTQACVLLSSQAILTKWADGAVRACSGMGVSRGRWEFEPGLGQAVSSPAGGSAIVYYGDRAGDFAREFEGLAHVFLPAWSR